MSLPLLYAGETERAIEVLNRAASVDPLHGDWLRWQQGRAYWQKGECKEGLSAMQSMSTPPAASNKTLAALYVCLDRTDDAKAALAIYLDTRPDFSLADEVAATPGDWKPTGTSDRWIAAMQSAGLE